MRNGLSDLPPDSEGEIHGLYVSADHLRQGIASALLGRVEADAKAEGVTELKVESSLAAVPFYKNMGFVEVERKPWPLSMTVSIEVVAMKKAMGTEDHAEHRRRPVSRQGEESHWR
jgi:N-acetylglutamate synthase-like GNAT family acetyltransferase